jgi:hypothetical protein
MTDIILSGLVLGNALALFSAAELGKGFVVDQSVSKLIRVGGQYGAGGGGPFNIRPQFKRLIWYHWVGGLMKGEEVRMIWQRKEY